MKRLGLTHATVVAYLALFIALSGTAVAATGGNLRLGMFNSAGETTVLKSNEGAPLALRSEPGVPPLRVNAEAKVTRLNADQLDSLDSSELQRRVSGACGAGTFVQSISADGSVVCGGTAPITTYQRFATATAPGQPGDRPGYAAAFCDAGDHVVGGGYSAAPRANIDVWAEQSVLDLSDPTNDYFAEWEGHDGYEVFWTDDVSTDPSQVHVIALCMRHQ
ncbi:MAG: hypothetical protein ACRDOX_00325 [Nocardioides sp.]